MRSSVLDIGSNTMRVVVFDISGESVKTIFGKGMKSVIFENTQNGKLTEIGMAALSKAISDMCAMTEQFGCDYHAFATSAFRDLSNQQEVIDFIYKQNGIKIRVLSGEEEAECDYLGMRRETGAVRGLGVDLGGGSCQVITFDESGMTAAASLKLGTVRLKNTFVAGNIPT
jgi:exopolyphosphatase/guanosine-5'-triphosphate,3'-diphosphate pyrophosphatase